MVFLWPLSWVLAVGRSSVFLRVSVGWSWPRGLRVSGWWPSPFAVAGAWRPAAVGFCVFPLGRRSWSAVAGLAWFGRLVLFAGLAVAPGACLLFAPGWFLVWAGGLGSLAFWSWLASLGRL